MFTIGQQVRIIRSSLIDRQATGRVVNVLMEMVRVELDKPHDGRSAMWFGFDQVAAIPVDVTGGPFDPGNRKP
jgi:hypothetical protein